MNEVGQIRVREDGSNSAEGMSKVLCGICRRQFSRYTCPGCNVSYCNLTCFRSEAHYQCSETFYRKEIQTSIETKSSKTHEERQKMLELLKRLEEQTQEEDSSLLRDQDGSDSDSSDLVSRFADVDISSASSDELLRLMTKEEIDKFFNALRDPTSQLAQKLLSSEELQSVRQEPWWEASLEGSPNSSGSMRYGSKPALMEFPLKLVTSQASSPSLIYNVCAVLVAYAFATRHLSVSPLSSTENDASDEAEARRIISQAVPFLVARRSQVLYSTLSSAVTDVWSRFDPGTMSAESLSALLLDSSIIARPRLVVATSSDNSLLSDHWSVTLLAALSDLSGLFAPRSVGVPSHIQMKLKFYAAQVLSTPQPVLHALANELQDYAQALKAEARSVIGNPSLQGKNLDASQPKPAPKPDITTSG
ncbi:uncharacterized protein F5891DRAFT_996136 [Suillus fuscotomentosus]|uniref:HIT-type domain-containing protein n=1 Tax=Suillus fuscotomentosus TaxID=1912939 RepID=A0AAD4HSW8_9AGAM|nr:uncharacterized protein F5891DRAFT_996136 [Suillus fuscotomentosus]KAG1907572.1 hypothetical protein F5891DRAFT_996136 [Suillus fuscotomentosus]